MIQFVQETDSKIIFSWFSDKPESPLVQPNTGTRASTHTLYFIPPPIYSSLIGRAWVAGSKAKNAEVGRQVRVLLSTIQEMVSSFELSEFDIGILPPLQAYETEDESLYVEWVFEHARVGFSFGSGPDEAGWFLVSDKALGDVNASGLISGLGVGKIFLWLFNFVIASR